MIELTDRLSRLVVRANDIHDSTQLAALNELYGLPNRLMRSRLRSALNDAVVPLGCLHQASAFPYAVADRLLAVNILAGLRGQNCDPAWSRLSTRQYYGR